MTTRVYDPDLEQLLFFLLRHGCEDVRVQAVNFVARNDAGEALWEKVRELADGDKSDAVRLNATWALSSRNTVLRPKRQF